MEMVNFFPCFGRHVMFDMRLVISSIEFSRKSVFLLFDDRKAIQLDNCNLMVASVWMTSLEAWLFFVRRTEELNENAAAASDEQMIDRVEWCRNVVFHYPQQHLSPVSLE